MKKTMPFINLDISPMRAKETNEERELRERIQNEFSDQAREVGEKLREGLQEILDSTADHGYIGLQVRDLLRNASRYVYLKGYDDCLDVEIDLLTREFRKEHWIE